jgi:hypothetical protein
MLPDRITKETPGSELFLVDGRPVKPKVEPLKDFSPTSRFKALDQLGVVADRTIGEWSTKKMEPAAPVIPAGTNEFGQRVVRNSLSNPDAAKRLVDPARNNPLEAGEKVSRPLGPPPATPALERVGRMIFPEGNTDLSTAQQQQADEQMARIHPGLTERPITKEDVARDVNRGAEGNAAALTMLEIVNDASILTGSLRPDWANPDDKSNPPVTVFETPDGKTKFTTQNTARSKDQRIRYYRMKDGTIVEAGDYKKTFTNPDGSPTEPISRKLPNGRILTPELLESRQTTRNLEDYVVVAPTDPRAKGLTKQADGRYYYPIAYELADGSRLTEDEYMKSTATGWLLPDGRTLALEAMPQTEAEWKEAFYQYRAPDRTTVVMNADGSVPEDMQRAHMEQLDPVESSNPLIKAADWVHLRADGQSPSTLAGYVRDQHVGVRVREG